METDHEGVNRSKCRYCFWGEKDWEGTERLEDLRDMLASRDFLPKTWWHKP